MQRSHLQRNTLAPGHSTSYKDESMPFRQTGHNADIKVAGVTWRFRGREELEQAGADYVVDSAKELESLILNL